MLTADLDVDLLRDRQGILDLDAKASDGAFQLGMADRDLSMQPSYRPAARLGGWKCSSSG